MKNIIIIALLIAGTPAWAQKIDASKVPAPVKATFSKSFHGITATKWENENGSYEANFMLDGKKTSALFDAGGALLETETDISVGALPQKAIVYIANNYKGEKIKEAAQLRMANGDMNYEAEVNGTDLIFDHNGTFIKAVKD